MYVGSHVFLGGRFGFRVSTLLLEEEKGSKVINDLIQRYIEREHSFI
jgi:hypothetical protein